MEAVAKMYQLNPLKRNVLITNSEVIFHAPSNHDIDPRTIQQAIIIAEERFIVPALGYDLYMDLVNAKNIVVTDANKTELQGKIGTDVTLVNGDIVNAIEEVSDAYKKLWFQYLWKICSEAVMLTAFPEAFIQFGSQGIVHTSPTAGPMIAAGAVTPSLKSVQWAMDKKIMTRVDPLIEAMNNYLCLNKASYSKYTKSCGDCNDENKVVIKKSNIVMGIYDDDDEEGCDCE